MRSPDSSPLSSPVRKRQRLSSPTYDEQLGDLSQDDIAAFDALDARLSQSSQSPKKAFPDSSHPDSRAENCSSDSSPSKLRSTSKLSDDPDNPFTTGFTTAKHTYDSFTAASSVLPRLGFAAASSMRLEMLQDSRSSERSPSPQEPPEQDFDSWFQPTSHVPPVAFQTAAAKLSTIKTSAPIGFTKASNKGLIAPSSAALAQAREKMKEIWQEDPEIADSTSTILTTSSMVGSENVFKPASSVLKLSPGRPALRAVENSLNSPNTPTPLGFSRPSMLAKTISSPLPAINLFISRNAKPFKSPLINKAPALVNGTLPGSPLNPGSRLGTGGLSKFTPTLSQHTASSQHPLASTPITPASIPSTTVQPTELPSFSTPLRPADILQRGNGLKRTPAPFVTPFKTGMKPGQPGRIQFDESAKASRLTQPTPATQATGSSEWLTRERPGDKEKRQARPGVFDLTRHPNRRTLETSGLVPQLYTVDDLESMGINAAELLQITPTLAMYYSFHTPTATPLSSTLSVNPPVVLGPAAALDYLLGNGCILATKPWVDNHWCLILWKLAGMVGLDPDQELIPDKKRWCWTEVIRQLSYRYERELNQGKRPALRLITTQDAPAAYPMVLCVSNVTWSEGGVTDDGLPIEPHPELEVTDGWYRLRAQVDAPLARAIRRGAIRIGRKLGVAGARLSSEKKDPAEVLDAYTSTKLILSGNSSHLAPWHAKLGFRNGPCISTLHSLTCDGGVVAAMDVVVVKTHPVAFFEFIEDENGQRHREGPRSESEEAGVNEKWKRRWEVEMSKLRSELDKKLSRYEAYIDRLERRAGNQFNPGEDDLPPDSIENLYDELEDPAGASRILASVGPREAGWLARHIRDQSEKERAQAIEDLENEVKSICPPREVRSFRILIVQDACTQRRPANRNAQLTVWDVLNLSLSEGSAAGAFEAGQRYMVTNLMPTQQTAWMDCEPGSEVFLSTRRDSRWTPIKNRQS
ncbi:Breast cancer type 2 susceptibility [Hypsizygus marmoreus]|uniref:Breast cancer type 2 susceptibility n=1 Tax=Hypsizygus marmoreus TaxID=39966 RepID=A0A369K630_HYPMA|nr:Breast cancer type 2 susceptibility [Hypsizygus marmoreus]